MKKQKQLYLLIITACLVMTISFSFKNLNTKQEEKFSRDWESLQTHETPEWFLDAKFGIYFHWGIYSVPAFGTEWYPRHMYLENHKGWGEDVRPHHLEKYGADFHYHEFIPSFTAEHFNAEEWAKLFKASGAKYAGPVAEHCDNFSMWDSKVNPWNASEMGPKRDIVAELEKAIRGEGLKFVTTLHHQWNWAWYPTWNGLVDTSTAELREFYGEVTGPETFGRYGRNPEEFGPSPEFVEYWKAKVYEVVDNFNPDMLWFDSRLNSIPEEVRIEILAHYYNEAEKQGRSVVFNYKNRDIPKGAGVVDIERGRMNEKVDYPWLTDDSWDWIGWNYKENHEYKSANHILDGLIDIVSKNGCLLLNIGPKADGTIPEEVKNGLLELGSWLKENGEAIYETRPFITYGEGSTTLIKGPHGGVTDKGIKYQADDVRFTTNGKSLYIIQLGTPDPGQSFILKTFAEDNIAARVKIKSIEVLGTDETVSWSKKADGLHLSSPLVLPNEMAIVYKATMDQPITE
ncbi:alpha-L-fucosidase [Bacteroidota bacterium]